MRSRSWRNPLKHKPVNLRAWKVGSVVLGCVVYAMFSATAFGQPPVKITLDEAIRLALEHNHNLLAARTTIQQSEAQEITANLKPNPVFFADWEYLPFFTPSAWSTSYISDSTEADAGLSYLFERGGKRARRFQAARDVTAMTRSLVADNERTLSFQVATLFINVQLAESTLDLAREDLKSYQKTVDLSEMRYKKGAISEDDYLKIDLQLLQFQNDEAQAELATVQALSDLRNLLGYESVPATYDVAGAFDYNPVQGKLEDFQAEALQTRPDYRAAQQGVTGANSQYLLAKANGKQDVTVQANYSHVNAINAASFYVSVPLAIHNRNQGEIARTQFAITQSQQQEQAANNQVLTDVRDAYEGLQTTDRILQLYRSGYLERAKKDRGISEYAYQRGAVSLLDFLDAERSYRATQLAYRQAIASGLLAEEQLRQAVGTRSLP
jgi:outer membrane protein, heavy metal efflux system